MPWKVSDPVSERMKFISRLLDGERMTDLCREFQISRKTGHKIKRYFEEFGLEGLKDRSRKPLFSPYKTPRNIIEVIVQMREQHSTWGPKKIRERMITLNSGVKVPAVSTIGIILKEEGLIKARKKIRRGIFSSTVLGESTKPNDIWSIDFKGQFLLGNHSYCYPLTVSDHFSRFLLGCEALENTQGNNSQNVLTAIFSNYGLPDRMRSDNGAPFASTGRCGLSKLSVWLLRQGIMLERIEPGHPEQNGRHERIHLTLKQEATRPPGINFLQQQEKFDRFCDCYNHERPHESLGMKTPGSIYEKSKKPFKEVLEPLEYPLHDFTLRVMSDGRVTFFPLKKHVHVGDAFAFEHVGVRELEGGTWLVSFMDIDLGYIDSETGRLLEIPIQLTETNMTENQEKV